MKKKVWLIVLFFTYVFCFAQEEDNSFWAGIAKPAGFGRPFWAEMHSTLLRVEAAFATNSPDYDYGNTNDSYRPYIFANLGVDIPVWSGNFKDDKYGLSITLPFALDTWYDRFEPVTAPIINISYRFGAFDFNFINRFDSPKQIFSYFNIYNWAVKVTLFKHESTHLGDELTVLRADLDLPIKRIDVLTNYFEFVFTLNDPDNQHRLNHGFKFGFMFNYKFKDGWYTVIEPEADPDIIHSSKFPLEIFAQYQFQSPFFLHGFQFIASLEYRLRERFKYPFYYSGSLENKYKNDNPNLVNCFNVFAGIRYDNKKTSYFSKIGLGVHYYYGINPYGQFRSMPHFQQIGVAVVFE